MPDNERRTFAYEWRDEKDKAREEQDLPYGPVEFGGPQRGEGPSLWEEYYRRLLAGVGTAIGGPVAGGLFGLDWEHLLGTPPELGAEDDLEGEQPVEERPTVAVATIKDKEKGDKVTERQLKAKKRIRIGDLPAWIKQVFEGVYPWAGQPVIDPRTGQPFGFDVNKGAGGRRYSFGAPPTPRQRERPLSDLERRQREEDEGVISRTPAQVEVAGGFLLCPPPTADIYNADPSEWPPEWIDQLAIPPEIKGDPEQLAQVVRENAGAIRKTLELYDRSLRPTTREIEESRARLTRDVESRVSRLNQISERAGGILPGIDLGEQQGRILADVQITQDAYGEIIAKGGTPQGFWSRAWDGPNQREQMRAFLSTADKFEAPLRQEVTMRAELTKEALKDILPDIAETRDSAGKQFSISELRWRFCRMRLFGKLVDVFADRAELALVAIENAEEARIVQGQDQSALNPWAHLEMVVPVEDKGWFAPPSKAVLIDDDGLLGGVFDMIQELRGIRPWATDLALESYELAHLVPGRGRAFAEVVRRVAKAAESARQDRGELEARIGRRWESINTRGGFKHLASVLIKASGIARDIVIAGGAAKFPGKVEQWGRPATRGMPSGSSPVPSDPWTPRPPGVQVRRFGDYWVKRVDPNAGPLMQRWARSTIRSQAEALERLHRAGRPAAAYRYFERTGRLVTEHVGDPLRWSERLRPAYWAARAKDSWAMRTPFTDLKPGNYGVGYRAFDPALDPVSKALLVGGGIGATGLGTYLGLRYREGGQKGEKDE